MLGNVEGETEILGKAEVIPACWIMWKVIDTKMLGNVVDGTRMLGKLKMKLACWEKSRGKSVRETSMFRKV